MIICMNISTDGERHVVHIEYNTGLSNGQLMTRAQSLVELYDEVYVIDFKENEAFIDEVVLRGCRV